jgi:hypothetical protein
MKAKTTAGPRPRGARADDAAGRGATPNAGQNEGEGSQTGARHYDESLHRFIDSGKVNRAAEAAARAVDGPEGPGLRRAEDAGKQRSHGEDPELSRSSSG